METVIRNNLVNFLEEINLINDSRQGFRKERSCLTNQIEFFNDVITIYEEKSRISRFSKYYRQAPHRRLLDHLKFRGIDGKLLKLLENRFSEKKQCVVTNDMFEWARSFKRCTTGICNGPCVSPYLR